MIAIFNLRERTEFFDVVADRIWNAFWRPDGRTLTDVESALREVVAASRFPVTLVSVADDKFLGTVTTIGSDIAERPSFSPWIAALWVEPGARGNKVGHALMDCALRGLLSLGYRQCFLAARQHLRSYYLRYGWRLIEEGIGADRLDIFILDIGPRGE
ncbi:GNAT family N-acetyltransferase [Devosia soli]|uniref:GNAT family N-acetyltransferase n=1 Tax=Devosia soli TaxID=361041 RepID=UPI00069B33DB|nr:GNAT family N-acetyltransferase [Devosia soli]